MKKNKCITFDKEAQNNLPKWVKDKMQKDRKKAEAEQLNLNVVVPSESGKLCANCGGYTQSTIHQIKCLKVEHIS